MSYQHGIAALNLEMPPRVPRMEFSASEHWGLVKVVTGLDVGAFSNKCEQWNASKQFIKAWNYDFMWNVLIHGDELGNYRTFMGHAKYADSGTDFNNKITKLFTDPEDVFDFDFYETLGFRDIYELTRRFDENYDFMKAEFPDTVNMTGIYITCMSGLIDMLGWDTLLMAAGTDSVRFGDYTNRYIKWIEQYFIALGKSKTPVVMIHDDLVWSSGAFIHPDWYRKYIFPNYKLLFGHLLDTGKKIIFTSDGNYSVFINDIAKCGIHGFVLEPMTDMEYIADRYGSTHVFIGNADTRILLKGTKDEIYREVKRCMDIGKKYPGYFMAVGNHIPANTPVENALYYNEVYEALSKR